MTNWKGKIRTRKKPNREVLSVKFPLPPRPKTKTPTDKPKCMNELSNTTTPTPKPHLRINAFTSSSLEQVNISSISSTRRNGVSPEALAEKMGYRADHRKAHHQGYHTTRCEEGGAP